MDMQNLLIELKYYAGHISVPLALSIVATIGYLLGRGRRTASKEVVKHSKRALRQAQSVAAELEKISLDIRKNLAKHHANITRFKDRIGRVGEQQDETAWKDICREAEEMLKPTLKLATQISSAYDEIRHQSANLMTFTEARTDPLTNVQNRRALEDAMQAQFALMGRYGTPFSLALFDIDRFKRINDETGHLQGDKMLQELAALLEEHVRETDILARYGGDEFVIVMPQTDLDGASIFSERIRAKVQQTLSVTVSGGVASAHKGDNQETLFSRADSSLYQSKNSGRNCVYRHDGKEITLILEETVLNAI